MTDKDYTHLVVVVDRSGSMVTMAREAEASIKAMIADQRALPGKFTVSLFEFDHEFREVYDVEGWSLEPRGMTALLDSIATAIRMTGVRLRALPEAGRPDKVVVLITTDGQENASQEYSPDQVMKLIKHQTDEYNWTFVFTAANQDAIASAQTLGISHAMNFRATGAGARAVYATTSGAIGAYRSGVAAAAAFDLPEDAE